MTNCLQKRFLAIRYLSFLGLISVSILIGWGICAFQMKKLTSSEHSGTELAELSYLRGVLLSLESGNSEYAKVAIAVMADITLEKIIETDYTLHGKEQQIFWAMVLKEYKEFRETHMDLYAFPSNDNIIQGLPKESRDEWIQRHNVISNYLKNLSIENNKKSNGN